MINSMQVLEKKSFPKACLLSEDSTWYYHNVILDTFSV